MTSSRTLRVLVGDDQPAVLSAVRLLLKSHGHSAVTADNPAAVLSHALQSSFDAILIDLNYARDTTSGQEGIDLLRSLHEAGVETPVVVMTAWGSVGLAVEAMRQGACDFIEKPWSNADLLRVLSTRAEEGAARRIRQKRARSEIEVAQTVQRRLLPEAHLRLNTLDYAAVCKPASEVGGDLYDYLRFSSTKAGFVLADVSGKGVGAALLMAHLQASFRTLVAAGQDNPSAICAEVNRLFHTATTLEQYATVVFADYDDLTRELRYVNAGHLAPLLLRNDGSVERLHSTATVLGMFDRWACDSRVVRLDPGETLVVFSDGLEEVPDDLLVRTALEHKGAPAGVAAEALVALGVSAHQHDDITVLVLRSL
ncbi:MAG TPA: SpoIIE family protein phosphatase [Bryobacteraceae bacterium]|nr:SpoIIE family protein phosphatase [Bryobacteraceae bacterium]